MEEEDLYLVLGIADGGPELSQLEVRKSYRTRALLCHPDKRRGDAATAAFEFVKLHKAYGVLGDKKARKAYDELWKLRRSRTGELSSKRQKMMQDLRDRELSSETQSREKREEEEALKGLKVEIVRLKAEIARIRAMRPKKQNPAGSEFSFGTQRNPTFQKEGFARPAATARRAHALEKTMKAAWSRGKGSGSGYTASRLTKIFREFGVVEEVVIRRKSKRKGCALVVMDSKEAVTAATEKLRGDLSNPLQVVPVVPVPAQQTVNSTTAGVDSDSFDKEILAKKEKAAESARIIREMEEAEAKAQS